MTIHPLIWAIFALQALDAFTTIVALKKGGAEGPPIKATTATAATFTHM